MLVSEIDNAVNGVIILTKTDANSKIKFVHVPITEIRSAEE